MLAATASFSIHGPIVIVVWIVLGVLGYLIGRHKGRPVLGTLLGLILGPIGLIIIAVIPRRRALV